MCTNSYTNDIVKQLPPVSFKNEYDNKDRSLHNINFSYKDTTATKSRILVMDAIINRNVEIIPFISQLKYNQKYIIPFSKITLNENICNMAYILDLNIYNYTCFCNFPHKGAQNLSQWPR